MLVFACIFLCLLYQAHYYEFKINAIQRFHWELQFGSVNSELCFPGLVASYDGIYRVTPLSGGISRVQAGIWPTFRIRHFRIYFHGLKCCVYRKYSLKFDPECPNDEKPAFSDINGWPPKRKKANPSTHICVPGFHCDKHWKLLDRYICFSSVETLLYKWRLPGDKLHSCLYSEPNLNLCTLCLLQKLVSTMHASLWAENFSMWWNKRCIDILIRKTC